MKESPVTEGKHTPGPWKFEPGHSVVVISGGDGRRIGVVDRAPYYQSYSEQDLIDARLIAAAPELLEALQLVVARCGPNSTDGAIARAVIAKATGAS